MIGYLSGTAMLVGGGELLIETGGVGYRVRVPERVEARVKVGDDVELWTRQLVRDDAIELVGFLEDTDTRLFDSLTSVSGVGPKAGLAILSLGTSHEVQGQILRGDAEYIAGAKGVGKKTAERVVLELKGSLEGILESREDAATDSDVVEALVALGYSAREASAVATKVDRNLRPEERIREALKSMKLG